MSPLLTSAQRLQFTRFPKLDERMLVRHYLLSAEDLKQVMARRRDFNRLGYAAQLTVLKHLGRGLAVTEQPPDDISSLASTRPAIRSMPSGPIPATSISPSCARSSAMPNSAGI